MTKPGITAPQAWWQILFRFGAATRTGPVELGLAERFAALANDWRRETAVQSSVENIVMHPAYQQIIGMGPGALPLIMQELRKSPEHWFWALWAISGENPVPPEHTGKVELMAKDWLEFGRARGWIH